MSRHKKIPPCDCLTCQRRMLRSHLARIETFLDALTTHVKGEIHTRRGPREIRKLEMLRKCIESLKEEGRRLYNMGRWKQ
jgi:hypothetical protein